MNRFWNVVANGFYWLLIVGAVVSMAYVFGHAILGCSRVPPLTPDQAATAGAVLACADQLGKEIRSAHSCPEAQLALDAMPVCKLAYPRGLDLDCPEFRGGR